MPLCLHDDATSAASTNHSPASAAVEVKNGLIEGCKIRVPPDWLLAEACGEFSSLLISCRFCPGAAVAAAMLRTASNGGERGARFNELCHSVAVMLELQELESVPPHLEPFLCLIYTLSELFFWSSHEIHNYNI